MCECVSVRETDREREGKREKERERERKRESTWPRTAVHLSLLFIEFESNSTICSAWQELCPLRYDKAQLLSPQHANNASLSPHPFPFRPAELGTSLTGVGASGHTQRQRYRQSSQFTTSPPLILL